MKADYVIVGAGSAGCALAYRMAQAGFETLLLEFGGRAGPLWNWKINMPAALSYPMNMPKYDWGYASEPEPQLDGRRLACPRGKVWGGSSAINGMVYVRGHDEDFNFWQSAGATGWDAVAARETYMRLENAPLGQAGWRGTTGPLRVTRATAANPLHQAFIAAGQQAGHTYTADYNGEAQEGVCHFDQTIWNGRRWSAALAYLRPALQLPNFTLLRARAHKVVFDGARAVAVEARTGDEIKRFYAGREIILCASAINSPALLLRSGVGDEKQLRRLGVPVVAHRAGVGENLQDHLECYVQQRCKQPVTLNGKLGLAHKGLIGLRWLLTQTGDGATNHFESGAFLRSPWASYPDVQMHFLPAAIRYDGKTAAPGHGFQAHVGHMRSEARGRVWLEDAAPEAAPKIQFNYMSGADDWRNFRHAIRMAHEIFAQPAMAEFCGAAIALADESDAAIDDYIRAHAESAYHPCGTCKMGAADDALAVVDPQCRVIGVENLRVADSSIFPRITYGNLNAPSIMTGERAAALLGA